MSALGAAGTIADALARRPHEIVPFLILLLPLAGFVVLSLFGDAIGRHREARGAGILACGTVLGSFGLSICPTSGSSGSRPAASACP